MAGIGHSCGYTAYMVRFAGGNGVRHAPFESHNGIAWNFFSTTALPSSGLDRVTLPPPNSQASTLGERGRNDAA